MRKLALVSDWVRLLLPFLLLLAVGVYPRPHQVDRSLTIARQAVSFHHSGTASQELQRAAEHLPWRLDLWEQAGIHAFEAGDYEAALHNLRQAGVSSRLTQESQIVLGDAYAKLGDEARAVETWQSLLAMGPPSVSVYQRLADAYQKAGDLDRAGRVLEQWIILAPDDPSVQYRIGLLQSILRPDLALESLQAARRLDPDLASAVLTLEAHLKQASGDGDPAFRLLVTGRGLGAVNAWDLAWEAFRKAVVIRPDYAEAWAFLGEARQHVDPVDSETAYQDIQKALEINPASVIAQALHAVYWRRQGKPDLALVPLTEAARLEPENPAWQIELGNTLAGMGELYPALEHFQQAVDMAPNDGVAWQALAAFSIQYRLEITGIGIPAARRAMLLLPRDPANPDLLGQAMLWQGDLISARRFFERCLETDAGYAPAYLHLGMLYLQSSDQSLAEEMLFRAVELDPDGFTGDQALRQLELYLP
jgi:tetratricopeptide (TPR) repeat protein